MEQEGFETIARDSAENGPLRAAEALIERLKADRSYPAVFEARLMLARYKLDLPLIPDDSLNVLEGEARDAYQQAQVEAAREVGELFLADGEIYSAWPYLRAVGETEPVRRAIEAFAPPAGDDAIDGVVQIAYNEALHPRRGFELILEHYGICRAITNFGQYPSDEGRGESTQLLVDKLSADLAASLKHTIEPKEGASPKTDSIAALIDGRDWLFEGAAYYIDTSHVASIVRMSLDWTDADEATLRKVFELTEYGRHLADMYQFPGESPFENVYEDCGLYLGALLGEAPDKAVEHFLNKIPTEPDPYGNIQAQALVRLQLRLGRKADALRTAMDHLWNVPPQRLSCPSIPLLCQMAGDPESLKELGRRIDDPLSFLAGTLGESR